VQPAPPFPLANKRSTPAHDACCAPTPSQLKSLRRRAKLAELDSHLHCSIIGTCLSTVELRKLVPKFTALDRQHASDLDIHHAAVELAIEGGEGAKALHKALEARYAGAVRKFDTAAHADALLALWDEALKNGDIPPAYWALMTHPHATLSVRQKAFGDLHMLSHLVGAANRADIRRLVALEEENAALRDKAERQQIRLHELSVERDTAMRQLMEPARPVAQISHDEADYAALREALIARDEKLALHTNRREIAEQRALTAQQHADMLAAQLDKAHATLNIVQAECRALEQALQDSLSAESADDDRDARPAWLASLREKRVVYVGGRPGSNTALRQLVESAGGEFVVHDGGIEDRKGMFAAALPRADIVVFPVDCIDHDSMNLLKRVCERHQVDYHPVRTASVASFMELVSRLDANERDTNAKPPASRFCLKHG
jgi:hypothetical protein